MVDDVFAQFYFYFSEDNIQQEQKSFRCRFCLDHLFELNALSAKIFPHYNKMIEYRSKYQIKFLKQ